MTTASVYTAIFLGNASKDLLRKLGRAGEGLFENVKGEHITLKFRGSPSKIPEDLMGRYMSFEVLGIRREGGLQVVILEPLSFEDSSRLQWVSRPHSTLSYENGAKPAGSKAVAKAFGQARDVRDVRDTHFGPGAHIIGGQVGFLHDRIGPCFRHLPDADMVPTPRTST